MFNELDNGASVHFWVKVLTLAANNIFSIKGLKNLYEEFL